MEMNKLTKEEKQTRIKAIVVFFVIAILIRYATNKTGLLSPVSNSFLKTILQGVGPAIGAIVTCYIFKIKTTMTLKGNASSFVLPLVIFWLVPIFALGLFLFFKTGEVSGGILSILIYALFEETGWRGFLQPMLQFLPKFAGIIIVTVMWFVWHLNFELSLSNFIFFLILLAGSWGMRAIANKTHSLIAVSAFHASYDIYAATNSRSIVFDLILALCFVLWILYVIEYRWFKKRILLDLK
jgi:membrane protease YdiL (CAAX protease family)